VVPGYGYPGIHSPNDFTVAPRNNNTYEPTTIYEAPTAGELSPWVQFGQHDHVLVYGVSDGIPQYFPLQNYSEFNPDGDIQYPVEFIASPAGPLTEIYIDPNFVALPNMNVVHENVQSGSQDLSTVYVDTVREYSELSAVGWNVDFSTLEDTDHIVSPLAKWYQICFDANGVFTTAVNRNCKFSVLPQDLQFLN
jgi:hypothetical protein